MSRDFSRLTKKLSFSVTPVSSVVWEGGRSVNAVPKDIPHLNGRSAAKETTMKWFLRSLTAVLKRAKGTKPAARPEQSDSTPRLEVRS